MSLTGHSPELAERSQRISEALLASGGKQKSNGEIRCQCPNADHPDENPSFDWNEGKGTGLCRSCGFSPNVIEAADLLGIDWKPPCNGWPTAGGSAKRANTPESTRVAEVQAALSDRWQNARDQLREKGLPPTLEGRGMSSSDADLLGLGREGDVAVIPLQPSGELVGLKFRNPNGQEPRYFYTPGTGSPPWVPSEGLGDAAKGIIREGELNAAVSWLALRHDGFAVLGLPGENNWRETVDAAIRSGKKEWFVQLDKTAAAHQGLNAALAMLAAEGITPRFLDPFRSELGTELDPCDIAEAQGVEGLRLELLERIERSEQIRGSGVLEIDGEEFDFGDLPIAFDRATDFAGSHEEPIPPVLPFHAWPGFVTALGAREKKGGKSTRAYEGIAAVTRGAPIWGEETVPGRVLIFSEEPVGVPERRLLKMGANLERIVVVYAWRLQAEARKWTGGNHVELFVRYMAELRPVLTLIDTLDRFRHGIVAKESQSDDWGAVLGPLCNTTAQIQTGTLINCHAPKGNPGELRGSTAIGGAVDIVITVAKETAGRPVVFEATGRNHPPDFRIVDFDPESERTEIEPVDGTQQRRDREASRQAREAVEKRIRDFVESNPACCQSSIFEAVGGNRGTFGKALDACERDWLDKQKVGRAYQFTIRAAPA